MNQENAYEEALELLIKAGLSEYDGMVLLARVIDEWREVSEGMNMLSSLYSNSIPKA